MTTTYGFHISRETRLYPGESTSSEYVHARLVCRKDDSSYPRGLSSHELDGFQLSGFIHQGSDFGPGIIGFEPEYHSVFSVTTRVAQAQLKQLKRCDRQLAKDFARHDYARNGNSHLVAGSVAEALGLTFFCESLNGPNADYSAGNWWFYDVTDGISRVEALEQDAIAAYISSHKERAS